MSAIDDSGVRDMTSAKSADILRFWFDGHQEDWFAKNPAFDAQIRSRFLARHEEAAVGQLAQWGEEAASCLALVIVLDQFPRNMFRGEARAFATDPLAPAVARAILERGWDKQMTRAQQLFAFLPFEHSESLADQNLACELMKDFGEEQLRYALRHREIIERFGRFPHRNRVLGRESTAAEIEFLKQSGSGF